MKIGIIGGGASGMVAAIFAKNKDNEVIIFERNKECGKKILVTGNGRCNYWNDDQRLTHYQSDSSLLLEKIITSNEEQLFLEFFDKLGIIPKVKNGYYYPFSNQASTVKNALINEVNRKGITVKKEFLVTKINLIDNKFEIFSENEKCILDKVVIATGSYAAPKTGSDGMGYSFLKHLGHTIVNPLPALVQLKSDEKYLTKWAGVRTDAKITLYEDNEKIKEEYGEMQLTNYGISGICVFNLSNLVARGLDKHKKEEIYINFLPFIVTDYYEWFIRQSRITNKKIKELLMAVLNEKIVDVILNLSNISNKNFIELSTKEQQKIVDLCTNFKVNIIGTNTFNEAQVCSGGISLDELNLDTLESKLVKNLYIAGELLDVTGDCGGYNLGIAWRTGIKVGMAIRGENND